MSYTYIYILENSKRYINKEQKQENVFLEK